MLLPLCFKIFIVAAAEEEFSKLTELKLRDAEVNENQNNYHLEEFAGIAFNKQDAWRKKFGLEIFLATIRTSSLINRLGLGLER